MHSRSLCMTWHVPQPVQPLGYTNARFPPDERDWMLVPLDVLLVESVIESQDKMPVWHYFANWKYMGETQTPCLTMNS